MAPLYKNNETGIIQFHPKSGIGASLNSTEVAEDSRPVVPPGADTKTTAARDKLAKGGTKATGTPVVEEKKGGQ